MRGSRRLREGSVVRIPVGLLLKVLRRGNEEEKGTLLIWLTPDCMQKQSPRTPFLDVLYW